MKKKSSPLHLTMLLIMWGQKLNERREIFREKAKTRKTLFNTLITPYGARDNKHYLSSVDKQLNLDALFLDDVEMS